MLFKKVDLENSVQDIRIRDKRITDIASDLIAEEEEEVIYANGGALLPGLHDHHIHINATAASLNSLSCGPPEVSSEQELVDLFTNQLLINRNNGCAVSAIILLKAMKRVTL